MAPTRRLRRVDSTPASRADGVSSPVFHTHDRAKENSMKRLIALMMVACFSTAALTACNTMAGAGKDVQKVGEKVEQKAQDCKDAEC
jgi:predicted small secreted protein